MTATVEWTEDERKFGEENTGDAQSLIEAGDIKPLEHFRTLFENKHGRTTTLTDDQLITVIASMDDDLGDDWIIDRMPSAEMHYASAEGEQAAE